MIRDSSIDLTEDNKFGIPLDMTEIGLLSQRIESRTFPWNIRRITNSNQLQDTRPRRLYGDSLSDDMGMIVRRTSDNHWFFGNYQELKKPWFWDSFNEELFEFALLKPILEPCPRCGTPHITLHFYEECINCKIEMRCQDTYNKLFPKKVHTKYIAWQDAQVISHLDENLQMRVTSWKTPKDVLQSII